MLSTSDRHLWPTECLVLFVQVGGKYISKAASKQAAALSPELLAILNLEDLSEVVLRTLRDSSWMQVTHTRM